MQRLCLDILQVRKLGKLTVSRGAKKSLFRFRFHMDGFLVWKVSSGEINTHSLIHLLNY